MAKGDKITDVYYSTRSDGVKLFRFAVPNTKTGNEWGKPQFKIRQDQTDILYDEAIDVESAPYTYTETDIPTESDVETQPETDLIVQNNNMKNKVLNMYTDIKEWRDPKDSKDSYNRGDKCYYKEQFWISAIDNNISEPGGFANTWINI